MATLIKGTRIGREIKISSIFDGIINGKDEEGELGHYKITALKFTPKEFKMIKENVTDLENFYEPLEKEGIFKKIMFNRVVGAKK